MAVSRRGVGPRAGLFLAVSAGTGVLLAGLLLPIVGSAGLLARSASNYFTSQSTALCQPTLAQTTKIVDAKGNTIAHFYYQNRRIVSINQVPQVMQNALIAIEDVRFYEDNGIDVKGALRALLANGSSGSVQQGGSTLTQQYVKNALEACHVKGATSDTLSRKVREAAIALHLARTESKQDILQRYLNIVYFGDKAYGIGAAAEHFFGKPVQKLTLPESAMLAGLVQAPSAYDPVIDPKAALDRRNVVLGQMLKYHFIDQQQYQAAVAQPLGLHIHTLNSGCVSSRYPWFCSYVQAALSREIGQQELLRGGLTVHTTLNPQAQQAADKVLQERVPPHNAAKVEGTEVLIQPGTGHVEAIAVSKPYGFDPKKGQTTINYAVDSPLGGGLARGAVGSTFKVFVLASALKEGLPLSTSIYAPPTMTIDNYTDCNGDAEGVYDVHNAGADEAGRFDLLTGTWYSVNTFYAQLEQRVGTCTVDHVASSLGVKQGNGAPLKQYPEMVLGQQDYGLSAMDMAAAYAAFAAHGRYCPPTAVTSITDAAGKPVPLPKTQCTQALDPALADTVTSILEGVLTHPGATAASVGDPGRPAAAKTGTANFDAVSAFAGYVPQLAGFVWVGRPGRGQQQQPLDNVTLGRYSYPGQVFGATIAGPIWRDTFEKALVGVPVESLPSGPSSAYINGKQTAIPDVSGESPSAAELTLRQAGFSPVVSGTQVASYLPAGTVAYTSPAAGTEGTPGTTVVLYLSSGQPPALPKTSAPVAPSSGPAHPTHSSTPVPPPAHSPPGQVKKSKRPPGPKH